MPENNENSENESAEDRAERLERENARLREESENKPKTNWIGIAALILIAALIGLVVWDKFRPETEASKPATAEDIAAAVAAVIPKPTSAEEIGTAVSTAVTQSNEELRKDFLAALEAQTTPQPAATAEDIAAAVAAVIPKPEPPAPAEAPAPTSTPGTPPPGGYAGVQFIPAKVNWKFENGLFKPDMPIVCNDGYDTPLFEEEYGIHPVMQANCDWVPIPGATGKTSGKQAWGLKPKSEAALQEMKSKLGG